jgi:serine/threonine protein kinase
MGCGNLSQIYHMDPVTGTESRALKVFSGPAGRAERDAEITISASILAYPSLVDPSEFLVVGFHPFDLGSISGYFMKFCPHGDLFDYILDNPCSEDQIRHFLYPVLRALDWLHSNGFAHRSVQPENILLADATAPTVYLSDMSFVSRIPAAGFSHFVGAPAYSAPELFLHEPYKQAIDIWSFGVTLFTVLTRKPPFPDPEQNRDDFLFLAEAELYDMNALEAVDASADVKEVIALCLKSNPAERVSAKQLLRHKFWGQLREGYGK